MKIFLICPVRKVRESDKKESEKIVAEWESVGHEVYWPPRDTNQKDETGYRICEDNLKAIRDADLILVLWDGVSQGVLFDLGMAFALGKKVEVISLPSPTEGKSFQNMITEWSWRRKDRQNEFLEQGPGADLSYVEKR